MQKLAFKGLSHGHRAQTFCGSDQTIWNTMPWTMEGEWRFIALPFVAVFVISHFERYNFTEHLLKRTFQETLVPVPSFFIS